MSPEKLMRIEKLSSDIQNLLYEDQRVDAKNKLIWLVEHLEEYLQSWIGFARIEEIGVKKTLDGDVFCVLLAAINLVEEFIPAFDQSSFFSSAWEEFCNSVERIQRYPKESEIGLVIDRFVAFRRLFWEVLG